MQQTTDTGHSWTDWLLDKVLRGIIGTMLLLPYRLRVPFMGRIMRHVIAPMAGYNRRSVQNLEYIYPDMSRARQRQILAGAADNMGRTFIENYSTKGFAANLRNAPLTGPGVAATAAAKAAGRPVILVSGHFGNYEAGRIVLAQHGHIVGALYRRAKNRYFNAHYEKTFLSVGGPMFAQGRQGTTGFVRHLADGGTLAMLFDQHVLRGAALTFLGKPAATTLSAARLALRYDALLIPFYATRRADGLSFEVSLEAPLEHSDAQSMTRVLNASLGDRITANPEQWLWAHRRWKIKRKGR